MSRAVHRFAFFVNDKPRTRRIAKAVAEGAAKHGDFVWPCSGAEMSLEDTAPQDFVGADCWDGIAVVGMNSRTARLRHLCKQKGKRFLYFDRGYIGASQFVRVSIDEWYPAIGYKRPNRPDDRFLRLVEEELFGVGDRRVPRSGDVVLIAGTSQKHYRCLGPNSYCSYSNDMTHSYQDLVFWLRRLVPREQLIAYRPDPAWAAKRANENIALGCAAWSPPEIPLSETLRGTRLVVTHNANAGLQAIAAGVPVLSLSPSIITPVSMPSLTEESLRAPWLPTATTRRQFFCDVAYCQWTLEEYSTGVAWEDIRRILDA